MNRLYIHHQQHIDHTTDLYKYIGDKYLQKYDGLLMNILLKQYTTLLTTNIFINNPSYLLPITTNQLYYYLPSRVTFLYIKLFFLPLNLSMHLY